MDTTARGPRPRAGATRLSVALGAALLMVSFAGSGCSRSADDTGGGDTATGLGSAPTPAATPAAGGEQGGQPTAAGGGSGYPDTPRAYAEAVVEAWGAADLDRLGELTTGQVHDQLIQIPGPPPPDWTWVRCDDVAYCTFYNSAGDHVALRVPVSELGEPHAVNQVSFTTTTYPQDHLDYLKEFVAAWQTGNVARMHHLARPEVVEVYLEREPGPVTDYGLAGGGGGLSIVVVLGVGFEIETHIGTQLLGGPQAIIHAVPEI